ncbi:MAG TPA: class I SAM-dependent methyltransferase [Pseudoduganella sp.]|jgi:hypothetical protein
MSTWSAGYVSEVGYTYGVYPEMNPLRSNLALLNGGSSIPEIRTACELGFGQGLGINVHAAASEIDWYGTDFNPSHAVFAQELARVSGANAHLYDQSFEQFCSRDDLPDFDFIGLHGIWSWVSESNRRIILDFISRRLKVGGVAFVSYNTQPGWAPMVPLRDLISQYDQVMCSPGSNILGRVDQSLAFAERLLATNPRFSAANPQIAQRLTGLKAQPKSYLAHEYFNREWKPMLFSEIAGQMETAKLGFAASADYLRQIPSLNCSADQLALIREIEDSTFRETVYDFMGNQQFRKDYWSRGTRKLMPAERAQQLRQQRVVLATPLKNVSMTVKTQIGEVTLQEAVYRPILDALGDYQPKSIADLERACEGVNFANLVEAVFILVGSTQVQPAQPDEVIARVRPRTEKLNARLCELAIGSADIAQLASPVTGGGVSVGRFHQLMLLARRRGLTQPVQWTGFVNDLLASQNERLSKNGEQFSAEEQVGELTRVAGLFSEQFLPLYQGLGIA